jgi:hypothetical protein
MRVAEPSGAFASAPGVDADDRTSVSRPGGSAPSRRPVILALVAVALCLVVIVVLLTRPRDEAAPVTTPTRTAVATQSQTTDSAIGDGVFAAPIVVANPKVGAVEFTWSYSGPKSTDTYRVHVGATPDEAQIADPVTLAKATYAVKVSSGSPMCLITTVVRAGQISPASPAVCGTAR